MDFVLADSDDDLAFVALSSNTMSGSQNPPWRNEGPPTILFLPLCQDRYLPWPAVGDRLLTAHNAVTPARTHSTLALCGDQERGLLFTSPFPGRERGDGRRVSVWFKGVEKVLFTTNVPRRATFALFLNITVPANLVFFALAKSSFTTCTCAVAPLGPPFVQ